MVQRQNLREQVVSELGRAIAQGDLSPGDTLPNEADLGEAYGVSRTVIREAIKGLAARGLVESRSRVGTTVRPWTEWKLLDADVLSWTLQSNRRLKALWELTEMRLVVEPVAAKWAAERAKPNERRHIKQRFKKLEEAIGNRTTWIQADVAFHDSILMACRNDLVMNLVSTLRGALHESREATVIMMEQARDGDATRQYAAATRQALELHRVPCQAIIDGDGGQAYEGMRAIIEWVMEAIRSRVDEEGISVENPLEDYPWRTIQA